MKKFNHRIFTQRKIIVIFLLAIFLPSIIVGYLSFTTFTQRREAVRKLLESNRWISSETAINSIEKALLEQERKALKSENFNRILQVTKTDSVFSVSSSMTSDYPWQFFLLDADFNIIFPKTGSTNESGNQWGKENSNSAFSKIFAKAESLEFSQKDYKSAAELYRACTSSALSAQQRVIALEGMGRCLFLSHKVEEAEIAYKEICRDYGHLQNKAGHPYGMLAALQLYEVTKNQKKEEQGLKMLLDLYQKIGEGVWLVNSSIYDFYTSEIETILNGQLKDGRYPKIQKSYLELQKHESSYREKLAFSDFLHRIAIPKIKEKLVQYREADEAGRLLVHTENGFTLISYAILPNFLSGQSYYGGFCWDSNYLKNQLIPKILKEISKESGLDIQIMDESGRDIISGKEELPPNESLTLNFRQFPLPWKLIASHSEIKTLEHTANREILFFGILLSVILALMLLGAVLIIRDISRESETTRLKTEFVHTISHELKTPLTLIRLYGETLQRKDDLTREEQKDCYEIITKESERLTHLINNVLDFSRIEMGKKEFDFAKGNLAEVIEDTLEAYRYHLEKKGFVVHKEIAHDLPEMNFDGDAMASLLINLLSNAMKFSLNEKVVKVKLYTEDGNVILQVTDHGVGISKSDIPKIFQQFYQSENKIISERRGSGLGLTLVKHITEAHQGKVQVESEIGKGSQFSILLPLINNEKEQAQ